MRSRFHKLYSRKAMMHHYTQVLHAALYNAHMSNTMSYSIAPHNCFFCSQFIEPSAFEEAAISLDDVIGSYVQADRMEAALARTPRLRTAF